MRHVFLCLLAMFTLAASAQNWQRFTPLDGLPGNQINCVHTTQRGEVLFATTDGIFEAKGKRFNRRSGSSGYVSWIAEEENGTIWAADKSNGTFWSSTGIRTKPLPPMGNDAFVAWKGRIIKTNLRYLMVWNNSNWETVDFWKYAPNQFVFSAIRHQNRVLLATSNGIWEYDGVNCFKTFLNLKKSIYSILPINSGFVLGMDKRALFIDSLGKPRSEVAPGAEIAVQRIDRDGNGNYWFEISENKFAVFDHGQMKQANEILNVNKIKIFKVVSDNQGNSWMATDNGVYGQFKGLFTNVVKIQNAVSAIQETDLDLFVGTINGMFRLSGGLWESVIPPSQSQMRWITDIEVGKSLQVYGNWEKESSHKTTVELTTIQGKQYLGFGLKSIFPSGLVVGVAGCPKDLKVNDVCQVGNQYWWATNQGLYVWDGKMAKAYPNKLQKVQLTGNLSAISTDNNSIWVSGENGTCSFNASNGKWLGDWSVRMANALAAIDRNCWVATEAGLVWLSKGENIILTSLDGLPSDQVKAIRLKNNDLFVGTSSGLSIFPEGKWRNFFKSTPGYLTVLINQKPFQKIAKFEDGAAIAVEVKSDFNELDYRRIIQYRISSNSQWIQLHGSQFEISAPSSSYDTLFIRAGYQNGEWSDQVVVPFSVNVAWYNSTYFRIILGVSALVLLVLVVYGRILNRKREQEFQRFTKARISELEQKATGALLNPSFIFGTLDQAGMLVADGMQEKASELLAEFSKLVQLYLSHSARSFVGLDEELNRIDRFLSIECQSSTLEIAYEISVDDALPAFGLKIPSMILQPFVENALVNGLKPTGEGGKIEVLVKKRGKNMMDLWVIDNGKSSMHQLETSGLVTVVRDRIEQLYNNIGNMPKVEVMSPDPATGCGTVVHLVLGMELSD